MASLKKKNFNEAVEEAQAEREVAPVIKPIEDEYTMIAGYKDGDGKLHTTFTIRPMTGEDEEALARFQNSSAAKLMTEVLGRCVLSIGTINKSDVSKSKWKEIMENLYVADQDYIMMRIRETSIGDELKVMHKCTSCGASITTYMTVDELDIIEWDGEEGVPFELPRGYVDKDGKVHKTGILRYPRVKDREATVPIASKNGARGKTIMLTRLLEFDDEDVKVDEKLIQRLTVGDRNYLTNLLTENQFGLDMNVHVECPDCGNEFEGGLNAVNFMG